jgi:hypothetical protein
MLVPRIMAGLGAFGLAVLGTAAASLPASAEPTTTTEPAPAAAGWLATQLVDGNHMVFAGSTFADPGLTVDAVLAFDAAKVAQDAAARATAWLATPSVLSGYIGDGSTVSRVGGLAKVSLAAEAQRLDPAAFGGRDLLRELRALQTNSGRFSDKFTSNPGDGDFSNGITQSLAILALHRAGGDGAPHAAVDFLVGTQCQSGGFPLNLPPVDCVSDPDTTGFAVQALLATGKEQPAARALDWLVSVQQADGGFTGSGPTADVENTNSTALAAQALRAGGRTAAADRAVGYLVARQVGCSGPPAQQGAIAYDKTGFKAGTVTRATAQAVPALAGVALVDISATGAAGPATRLACAPSPTPSQPTGTHTANTATPTPTVTAPSSAATGGAATGGGSLPATGAPTGAMTGIAGLLLASGCGLLLLARRRGVPRRVADR